MRISERITEYKLFKAIVSKSKLIQEDALKIGDKISQGLYKQYKKRLKKA